MLWEESGFELDEGAWDFAIAFGDWYANDCSIDNGRVGKKDGFDFRRRDLPATDFDEVLPPCVRVSCLLELGRRVDGWTGLKQAWGGRKTYLRTIDYVHLPLPGVCYVSGLQTTFLVERGGGGGGIIQVSRHHSGSLEVHFSVYVILVNSVTVKVLEPIKISISSLEWEGILTLCSCLVGLFPRCQYRLSRARKR